MFAFEMLHRDRVVGKLTAFDRLIFKGHLARRNTLTDDRPTLYELFDERGL